MPIRQQNRIWNLRLYAQRSATKLRIFLFDLSHCSVQNLTKKSSSNIFGSAEALHNGSYTYTYKTSVQIIRK